VIPRTACFSTMALRIRQIAPSADCRVAGFGPAMALFKDGLIELAANQSFVTCPKPLRLHSCTLVSFRDVAASASISASSDAHERIIVSSILNRPRAFRA
jgi:hypothetical protein